MAEAVRLVTAKVAADDLADSVIIRCAAGNHASRRVAEAAGYVRNGVQAASEPLGDGTLDDLVLYTREPGRPSSLQRPGGDGSNEVP